MKKFLILALLAAMLLILAGCSNYQVFDTNWDFDTALIGMPDGEVREVSVRAWSDSEGEQLTITALDGTVYLVSSNNCVLIDK